MSGYARSPEVTHCQIEYDFTEVMIERFEFLMEYHRGGVHGLDCEECKRMQSIFALLHDPFKDSYFPPSRSNSSPQQGIAECQSPLPPAA